MKPPSRKLLLVAVLLYLFLYAPIVAVIAWSFNAAEHGARWGGFTVRWYPALLENHDALRAAGNTALLAISSTLLSTVLGTLLGYGLGRYEFPGRRLCLRFLQLPVFVPDIVMAVALLLFYKLARGGLGLFELGLPTMIVSHVTFQIPFVAIVVRSRLAGLDPALEEAAHDLGANAWQTFRHVTLPLLRPGILAGAILAFTLSLDDFIISFFTSGPGSGTLPTYIYATVKRRGVTPEINALATLLILASVAATLAITRLRRRP